MKDKLRYTHDDLFRATWSDKENAGSFLENNLPVPVRELVDLETLEICKNSFIDNDLKDYYSDMLYKARIGNSQGFVY
jgi:predicted transposase/invertase (TIGR01784 family)